MEENSSKKVPSYSLSSSSSSSSSIAELFGPKDSSSSSAYSHSSSSTYSSSIFGSVFGPTSMGRGRDSTGHAGNVMHGAPGNRTQDSKGESGKSSYYQQETIDQPCYYSSSIYYGGQEVYCPTSESHLTFKKDEQDDDPNSASRGNWWKGSLYY